MTQVALSPGQGRVTAGLVVAQPAGALEARRVQLFLRHWLGLPAWLSSVQLQATLRSRHRRQRFLGALADSLGKALPKVQLRRVRAQLAAVEAAIVEVGAGRGGACGYGPVADAGLVSAAAALELCSWHAKAGGWKRAGAQWDAKWLPTPCAAERRLRLAPAARGPGAPPSPWQLHCRWQEQLSWAAGGGGAPECSGGAARGGGAAGGWAVVRYISTALAATVAGARYAQQYNSRHAGGEMVERWPKGTLAGPAQQQHPPSLRLVPVLADTPLCLLYRGRARARRWEPRRGGSAAVGTVRDPRGARAAQLASAGCAGSTSAPAIWWDLRAL